LTRNVLERAALTRTLNQGGRTVSALPKGEEGPRRSQSDEKEGGEKKGSHSLTPVTSVKEEKGGGHCLLRKGRVASSLQKKREKRR